jgi:hypothetical protein
MSAINGGAPAHDIWVRGGDADQPSPAGEAFFGQTRVFIHNLSNLAPGTINSEPPPRRIVYPNILAAQRAVAGAENQAAQARASPNGVLPAQVLPELSNQNSQP